MEKEFACAICFEVCNDAVETGCCHHIYCQNCVVSLTSCPECRAEPFSCSPAIAIRRIISNLPYQCPNDGCNQMTSRGNLKDHLVTCAYTTFTCPGPGCNYIGIKDHFAHHIYTNHTDTLVKRAGKLFISDPSPSSVASTPPQEVEYDRVVGTQNGFGRTCRLGSTGKYYCGGSLGSLRCTCCNGYCGTTNGCNCEPCMKLDVTVRKLPRGWYVNRDGFACRKGISGFFFCGRKVMVNDRRTDGYCGPTDGPNCHACSVIDDQSRTRYRSIWS